MNDAERLVGYLRGRDAACPGCGYNLRDLRGTRCPECGEGLTVESIKYVRRSPLIPSFFVGCVGLVGGGLVILAIWPECMNWEVMRRGRPPGWDDLRFCGLLGATLGLVVLAAKWIDWADEMTRRSDRFRWGWAAACWGTIPLALLLGRIVGRW